MDHGDSQGLVPLASYFATATFDDAAPTTESPVLAAYGRPLRAVRDEWLAWPQIAAVTPSVTRSTATG